MAAQLEAQHACCVGLYQTSAHLRPAGLSENGRPSTAGDDELHIAAGGDDAELLSTANRTAQLASLAEQADIK